MNYWLFKSEPSSWSWQDQLKRGVIEDIARGAAEPRRRLRWLVFGASNFGTSGVPSCLRLTIVNLSSCDSFAVLVVVLVGVLVVVLIVVLDVSAVVAAVMVTTS